MGFGAGKSALEIPFDELDVRDQIGGGRDSLPVLTTSPNPIRTLVY